jgi:hypothetical protein
MSELFPLNTAAGGVEMIKRTVPRVTELVEMWGNYLEFWAQTGGMDEATPEEIEQAHDVVQARADEILGGSAGVATAAYSNLALAAAKDLRQQAFSVESGELDG